MFPDPNRLVARIVDSAFWKLAVCGFEFLQADDIWLAFTQPAEQVFKSGVDPVDIESGDKHVE